MGFLMNGGRSDRGSVTSRSRSFASAAAPLFLSVALIGGLWGCSGIRIRRPITKSPADWVMYGGAPERANYVLHTIHPPLKELWEYNALAGISTTPLVRDSMMLIGTLNGELQAVNLATGDRIGYVVLASAIAGTPVWDGIHVYVPSAAGKQTLVRITLENGKREWVMNYGPIESSPLLFGELLYVTTLDGILYCINKVDGMEVWKFETREQNVRKPIRSSPASDGAVIVFGSDDGFIYAVERAGGTLRWKYETGASVFATPIIVRDKCIVGSLDGTVYAIDLHTGNLVWKHDTGSKIYGAAAADDARVYVGSADGKLHALMIDSGAPAWTYEAQSVIDCAPLVAGDVLYMGSLDRTLYALRASTGEELWHFDAPGRIRVPPVIWGTTLLLTSEDKYVLALTPAQ
jgi:outer membrane protein assembly factor BamB